MTGISPLNPKHEFAGASLAPYGPPEGCVLLVETFGQLEIEYAAIRKAAALIDLPHRAVIAITGDDRIEFLNRMVTQELKDLTPGDVRRSFWLNRKGRIDADLTLLHRPDQILVDLDVHAVTRTIESLSEFIFTEDVRIDNAGDRLHRLALHGPGAAARLAGIADEPHRDAIATLEPDHCAQVSLVGVDATVFRHDSTGEVGLELILPTDQTERVYDALVGDDAKAARPAGWHAYNVARIEAGTPIYNLDFGPDSLPHESGVLEDRVSFTKGCYLGQEVVARIHALGHPKQRLVALRLDQTDAPSPLPITGTSVHPEHDPGGKVIGAITSATISPMLGAQPIMFAMVRYAQSEPGTRFSLLAEGTSAVATVQDSLTFWSRS